MHSDPAIQRAYSDTTPASVGQGRSFSGHALPRQSIRLAFDYQNLRMSSKYCTSASDLRPFISSGPASIRQCSDDSIFSPTTMVPLISEVLMPSARRVIESAYNVTRISTQTIRDGQCGDSVDVSGQGGLAENVDLLIFVAAGVMSGGYDNTLAYAYPCTFDPSSGRPISAVVNFNPKYLASWSSGHSTYDNDELVQTAIHEIHHAMGFTRSNLESRVVPNTVRGKTVYEIRTPNVLSKGRALLGCDSLSGVEIEDEGGDGSRLAHWERRVLFEEMMVAAGGSKLSALTLAFMEDLGYYTVDYTRARRMVVGSDAGCGFVEKKCNENEGGRDLYWFFDGAFRCSPDHRFISKSSWGLSQSPVPSYFQYDPANPQMGSSESGFTDRCPYGIRVLESECAWEVPNSNGGLIGSYPGIGSRCFETSGLKVDSSGSSVTYRSRCFKARCPFGGTRIEFYLGGKWTACPLDGAPAGNIDSPSGFSGTIECPRAKSLCDEEISFGSSERERRALGVTSLPEAPAFTALSITVFLNGTRWASILADDARPEMMNRLRQDFGFLMKSSSLNTRIRRIVPTESGVRISIGTAEDAYGVSLLTGLFSQLVHTTGLLPFTEETYSRGGDLAAEEAPTIAVVQFSVDEPESGSICGSSIVSTTCVTIIAVVVFGVVSLFLFVIIFCVCVRSPFGSRPRTDAARKYVVDESPASPI